MPSCHDVRPVARLALRAGVGTVTAAIIAGVSVVAASAAELSVDVAPTAITSSVGGTGAGQSVAALKAADQSGAADDWARYVEFQPKAGQQYLGERSFYVPAALRTRARQVALTVNFRGPGKADQAWTWSAYDWKSKTWVAVGDNGEAAGWGSWSSITVSAGDASRVIGPHGVVRVQLKSNNAADVLNVDAETLRVSTRQGNFEQPSKAQPSNPQPSNPQPPQSVPAKAVTLPPVRGQFDYQLGAAYTPPSGVKIVTRDRTQRPAAGLYNICYLNGLQTQPDEIAWWQANRPELLLTTRTGERVYDSEWGEVLFDVSTDAKRRALLQVQKGWIDDCAAKGYHAVEADGQDSYSRSKGLLTFAQNKEFMKLFTAYAHSKGLAVAQKNAGEEYAATGKSQVGFDFAVAEECQYWNECDSYTDVYGRYVLEIEYTDQPLSAFTKACELRGTQHSIVRRDRQLVAPGKSGYSYAVCPNR